MHRLICAEHEVRGAMYRPIRRNVRYFWGMTVQLLYFAGCPNLEAARAALRDALEAERLEVAVEEVDIEDPATPVALQGWGSPTVLVDGRDVTGEARSDALSCRAGGAPSIDVIRRALRAA
jgi:hypothetical protein